MIQIFYIHQLPHLVFYIYICTYIHLFLVLSSWLFNVYMDEVVNVRVLGKGLELLNANGGRFEINQLLFADDTALVAD